MRRIRYGSVEVMEGGYESPSTEWDAVYTWESGKRDVERNGAGPPR